MGQAEEESNDQSGQHLKKVGIKTEENYEGVNQVINYSTAHNADKRNHKVGFDLQRNRQTDNYCRKADNYCASPHIYVRKALILGKESARNCDNTVGDRQSENLVKAYVDTLRTAHCLVITGGLKGKANLGVEEEEEDYYSQHAEDR